MKKNKLVVVGGGFAGLNAVKSLAHSDLDILLIDTKNHHLFQPLLYQVAAGVISPAEIATPFREILKNQKNVSFLMATVVAIEKEKKQVLLGSGEIISYDFLILAVGARHSYFGNNEWEALAPGLKTIDDALTIREKILLSFEKAERLCNKESIEKYLNFVIVGAGPTGIEMAGAIAEIAHKTLFRSFSNIDPKKSKIYLIEGFSRVLPSFPEKLSFIAKKSLENMGVIVLTGERVNEITKEGVVINGKRIEAENIIWAAGNQASFLLKTLNEKLDNQGRVIVDKNLSINGHPEIFIVGDAAHRLDENNNPLPAIAPVAIQQGIYVAKQIRKNLKYPKPFKYFDKGSIATIGTHRAVGFIRHSLISGFFAWVIWCLVHVMYLVTFRNRIIVMLKWAFNYLTGGRSSCYIKQSIDEQLFSKNTKGHSAPDFSQN